MIYKNPDTPTFRECSGLCWPNFDISRLWNGTRRSTPSWSQTRSRTARPKQGWEIGHRSASSGIDRFVQQVPDDRPVLTMLTGQPLVVAALVQGNRECGPS